MSVATIGSGSYQATSLFANYQQRVSSLQNPAGNVQAKDRAGTPEARASRQPDAPDVAQGHAAPGRAGIDLSALSEALDAGDLASAKKAFAALQQEHHAAGNTQTAGDAGAGNLPDDEAGLSSASRASGSTFQITA